MSLILAYFDPGPGSLLMQAIVGGAGGLIVFGKYLWNSAFRGSQNGNRNTLGRDPTQISSESSGEIPQDLLP
jgi:hypothetical protein